MHQGEELQDQRPREVPKFELELLIKDRTLDGRLCVPNQSCFQYCGMSIKMALVVGYQQKSLQDNKEVVAKLSTAQGKPSGIAWSA